MTNWKFNPRYRGDVGRSHGESIPHWKKRTGAKKVVGLKKCIINTLARKKATTPKTMRKAFNSVMKQCRRLTSTRYNPRRRRRAHKRSRRYLSVSDKGALWGRLQSIRRMHRNMTV